MEAKNEGAGPLAWPKVRKYRVTCTIVLQDGSLYSEEVEGNSYETQATGGAGLVADFYDNSVSNGTRPVATVAHVASVREVKPG